MSEKNTGKRVLMGTQVAAGVAAIVAAAYGAHDLAHPDRPNDAEQVTPGQYRYAASDGSGPRYVAVKTVGDIKVKGGPGASKTSVSVGPPVTIVGGAGGKDKKQGGGS